MSPSPRPGIWPTKSTNVTIWRRSDLLREVLAGDGQRENYASEESLVKRQSLRAFIDPSSANGGVPMDRIRRVGNERLLDVGCGTGRWLLRIAPRSPAQGSGPVGENMLTGRALEVRAPLMRPGRQRRVSKSDIPWPPARWITFVLSAGTNLSTTPRRESLHMGVSRSTMSVL